MSLTATNSSSESASWAARNRLRPILPNPLTPTFTAAIACALLRTASLAGSIRAHRHLYPVTVRVTEIGGVVGRTVLGAAPGRSVVAAARGKAALPGRLHRRNPVARETDVAATGAGGLAGRGGEHRLYDAPADHPVGLPLTPPPPRAEQGLLEAAPPLQVRNL